MNSSVSDPAPRALTIPELPPDVTGYEAALALAAGGLYVLPVRPGTKHPGSYFGKGWPSRSTRSPADIWCIWREDHPEAGVGIHAGRSGLVVIDIDNPALLPPVLRGAIMSARPPFQITRRLPDHLSSSDGITGALASVSLRGHALFAVPSGRMFGNSLGSLGPGWGDVRGANGFIVTVPTLHSDPDSGLYRWVRTGGVPELPASVARLLPDGAEGEVTATDAQVEMFLRAHATVPGAGRTAMGLISAVVGKFEAAVRAGAGRHTEALSAAVWAAREAAAGLYPAAVAFRELEGAFVRHVSANRGARRAGASLAAEFASIRAWAVGQVLTVDPARLGAVRERVQPRRPEPLPPPELELPLWPDVEQPPAPVVAVRERESANVVPASVAPAAEGPGGAPGGFPDGLARLPGTSLPPPELSEAEAAFWGRRKVLLHIRQSALARYAAPWAVLGVVLARVVAATSPMVQLPDLVGSFGSLNLFVALVAPPGGGKGAADAVGLRCVDIDPDRGSTTRFRSHALGSGEGLAHMFMRRPRPSKAEPDPEPYQYNEATLVSIAEIDTFGALHTRQGSTLAGQLRQAFMAEDLGFFYVDKDKRMLVPRHAYRLCLSAGVQPGRAGILMDDADGGTPQRFIWLPATNPTAPDPSSAPDWPTPWPWHVPGWPVAEESDDGVYRTVMPVCMRARQETVDIRVRTLRGEGASMDGVDGRLDGHANFARLKVAAALAILDSRTEVDDEDWELAGMVLDMSMKTRDDVLRTLERDRKDRVRSQGEAEAAKTILVGERVDAAGRQLVAAGLMKRLDREADTDTDGWIASSELLKTLRSDKRKYFQEALDGLMSLGKVEREAIEYRGTAGFRYRASRG